MVNQLQIYLFGDQTHEISAKLQALLHSKSSPILQSFFDEVYHKLRAEIGQLPARDKEIFPRFSSIAEILAWRKRQDKYIQAIENALTCTYQLAYFIRFVVTPKKTKATHVTILTMWLCIANTMDSRNPILRPQRLWYLVFAQAPSLRQPSVAARASQSSCLLPSRLCRLRSVLGSAL
jgi:hypothetical protein